MSRFAILVMIGIMVFTVAACGDSIEITSQASTTMPEATGTISAPVKMPEINTSIPFPFSEPGPYQFGTVYGIQYTDADRDGRQVGITLWYPTRDGKPDLSGAPYPLILSSTKSANIFAYHLVSYGFVVVGINNIDTYDPWDRNLVDQPLDILFALDQVASHPLEGLEEMIDAGHTGVMGYSFDGYNALALSGARIDPQYYLDRCANAASLQPAFPESLIKLYCAPFEKWDEFQAVAGEALTASRDGLWQPMTDDRIQAVLPMAPEGAWLFGERGLKTVDRPTLIIGATEDQGCPYDTEAAYIFDHLGTPDRFLLSFIGKDHGMIFDKEPVARMKHFSIAFFGYYLKGYPDYAAYFSEDFVSQHDQLAWGVYAK